MISPQLIEMTKRHEGFSPTVYLCPAGRRTIGYGRNLEANAFYGGEQIHEPLSRDDAEAILVLDLNLADAHLLRAWPSLTDLSGPRRDVLINMAFNMGVSALLRFRRLLAAVTGQQWQKAAAEMKSSQWATQTGDRARELAEIMRTGEYQKVA